MADDAQNSPTINRQKSSPFARLTQLHSLCLRVAYVYALSALSIAFVWQQAIIATTKRGIFTV